MKKLLYIFSIVIGLMLTGCEDKVEPLAPDTWGPVAELTVNVPDTLTTDVLPIEIIVKNGKYMRFTVFTEAVDMNYTDLLKGYYGGSNLYTLESVEDTISYTLGGVTPETRYYIYVVATNEAGVETTYNTAVGAVDVDAPVIVSTQQLTPADKGRRVTLAFNENILRDDEMGAITYEVYSVDLTTGETTLFATGSDVTAVATGANLTVTLPCEFAEDTYYVAMLSFAEGAVTDLYGNKMAAVQAAFDAATLEVTNGYWWLVEPAPDVNPEEFFNEGTYNFEGVFTFDGENFYEGAIPFTMSFVSDGYDMSQIFENAPFTGTKWELNGLSSIMFEGTDQPFPGFSYKYQGSDGLTYEYITIIDPEDANYLPCVGTVAMSNGSEYHAYLGNLTDDGYLSPYWDFVLVDGQGNPEGAVEDLMGVYSLETPIIIIDQNEGTGQSPQWGIIVQFDELYLTRGGEVEATTYTVYKEPRTLENVTFTRPGLEKKVFMNK